MKILSLFLIVGLAGACAAPQPSAKDPGRTPEDRAAVDADGVLRRGSIASRTGKYSVPECAAKAVELDGKTVRLDGWVSAVCQTKGCWFVLVGQDAAPMVRIRFEDYKYFVPKDIPGKKALVEGRLEVKKLSRSQAQHFEDDRAKAAGEAPLKLDTGVTELTLFATGIEILPGQG